MQDNNLSKEPYALVSNIQKYTIHDGPGIRTAVFFTGCTLRCLWCSNPETLEPRQRLGVYPSKCLSRAKCGLCVTGCPLDGAPVKFDENGVLAAIDMAGKCGDCLKCADACPPRAIKLWGEKMTVTALMEIITADRDFYDRSGGGVTLTGGEVMLQWEFAEALLRECKGAGINTCVETALNCPREHMEEVYRCTDLVITDIKHMDSAKHRKLTGAGNELILSNIRRTSEMGKPLIIRTPVVQGYNADEENLRKTCEFIANELAERILQYQLLPYRRLGTEKYASLGIPYPMQHYTPPERSEWEHRILELAEMLAHGFGLPVVAGSAQKPKSQSM